MNLRDVVSVVPPHELGAVHFIAIGGAGMSGIAQFYHQLGIPVSGCDRSASPVTRTLDALGITTMVGHDPAHLDGIDTVVVSSAIPPTNPELHHAHQSGLRIWHRSAALASLMIERRGISIAGSHGKTTTSAIMAVMLEAAGAQPSYVIGAPLASTSSSCHVGEGDFFIVEADESDGSFLQYPTEIAVITNVEPDHLDNWGTPEHYAHGFYRFASAEHVKAVVINIDDPGARLLSEELAGGQQTLITYGESEDAMVRVVDIDLDGTTAHATLTYQGRSWPMTLNMPGRYNVINAAAAFATGMWIGMEAEGLIRGAAEFSGTLRRFQRVGQVSIADGQPPVHIFDDYAHHPTELRAALGAARRAAGEGRLVACFQPHLYTRTRDFAAEFGEALTAADEVIITDVYAAREDPLDQVSGQMIADAVSASDPSVPVTYIPDKNDLPAVIAERAQPGDFIMTLGAGDVTLVGPLLVTLLSERAR